MKAIRYHGPGKPLRLEEVPKPPPGPGEVLVRIRASGICHTELHFLTGLLDLGVAPLILGHEIVGVVESLGPGVMHPQVGERVIVYYYAGCGRCSHCRRGDENLCANLQAEYGFVSNGGFTEFIAVPARNAVPLPANIRDEEAAPIGCGVTTAIHAARLSELKPGEVALVYGIGAVGYGLTQLGHLVGATVIAVGRTDTKLQRAKELGARFVVNAGREDVADRVRELTDGHGADVVFELVATRPTMEQSVRSLAKRGRLVFIGYSPDAFSIHPIQLVVNETRVMGSVGNTLDELYEAVRWVSEGKLRTVIDRVLGMERYQEGLDALAAGQLIGRAVLMPQSR